MDPSAQEEDAVERLSTIIGQDADVCRAHLQEKNWNFEEATFQFYEDREQNRARRPETKLPDRALEAKLERQRRRQRSLWVSVLVLPTGTTKLTSRSNDVHPLDCCVEVSMGKETIRSGLTGAGRVENFCLAIPSSHDLHIRIIASSAEAEAARVEAATKLQRSRHGKRMSAHQPAVPAHVHAGKVLSRHRIPVQQLVGVVDTEAGYIDDDEDAENADAKEGSSTPSTHQLRSFALATSPRSALRDGFNEDDDDDDDDDGQSAEFTLHVQWTTRRTGPLVHFLQALTFYRHIDIPVDGLQDLALSASGAGGAPSLQLGEGPRGGQATTLPAADRLQVLDGGISSLHLRAMDLLGRHGGEQFGQVDAQSSATSLRKSADQQPHTQSAILLTVLAVRIAENGENIIRLLPTLVADQLHAYEQLFSGLEALSVAPLPVSPLVPHGPSDSVPIKQLLRLKAAKPGGGNANWTGGDLYCLGCVRAAIRRRAKAGRGALASSDAGVKGGSAIANTSGAIVATSTPVSDEESCSECKGLTSSSVCAARPGLPIAVSALSTCLSRRELRELVKTQLAAVAGAAESKGGASAGSENSGTLRFVQCPNDACGVLIEFLGDAEKGKDESGGSNAETKRSGSLGGDWHEHLSAEQAFRKLRVRCGHCGLGFCTGCGATPYHVGLTCEEYKNSDVQKLECRFCSSSIEVDSMVLAKPVGQSAASDSHVERQAHILEDMVVCHFDGVSQFVDVPALRSLSYEETFEHYGMTALTVEAWIHPTSSRHACTDAMRSGYAVILAHGGDDYCPGFSLLLDRSPHSSSQFDLVAQISSTAPAKNPASPKAAGAPANSPATAVVVQCVSADAIDADTWTHVALTWSTHQEELRLFKNGKYLGAGASQTERESRRMRTPLQPWSKLSEFGVHLTIGGSWNQQHFHGHIAEVRVWAQARSEWQLHRDMCTRKLVDEANLLASWPLCDKSRPNPGADTRNSLWQNTVAFDRSGNQNHGVLHSCGSPVSDRMVVDPAADVHGAERVRSGHFRKPVWQLVPEEKFNAGNCGSLVTLDARTAVKQEKEWKLGSVVLQTAVTSGRVRWWFRINGGHKTTVGIVTSEYQAQRDSYINKGTQGWGYYQENGNKGNGGPATDSYGVPFPDSCSIVTVDLDVDRRRLRFYMNGVDQGVAYDDLPGGATFHAALSLYNSGDSVSFLFAERLAVSNAAVASRFFATSSSPKLRGIYDYLRGFPIHINAMFYLDSLVQNGWDTPDAILELAESSEYMESFRFHSAFRKMLAKNTFKASDVWKTCGCQRVVSQQYCRALRMWRWIDSVKPTSAGPNAVGADDKAIVPAKKHSFRANDEHLECFTNPNACLDVQRQRREAFYARAYDAARAKKLKAMQDRREARRQRREQRAREEDAKLRAASLSRNPGSLSAAVADPVAAADPELLAIAEQLTGMGFPLRACLMALEATERRADDAAMYLVEHPEVVEQAQREEEAVAARAKAEAAAATAAAEAAEAAALQRKIQSARGTNRTDGDGSSSRNSTLGPDSPRQAGNVPAPTQPWSCASCTYINEPGIDMCHMCGDSCANAEAGMLLVAGDAADLDIDGGNLFDSTSAGSRSNGPSGSNGADASDIAWHCQLCTFQNPPEFLACKVCGSPKIRLDQLAAASASGSSDINGGKASAVKSAARATPSQSAELSPSGVGSNAGLKRLSVQKKNKHNRSPPSKVSSGSGSGDDDDEDDTTAARLLGFTSEEDDEDNLDDAVLDELELAGELPSLSHAEKLAVQQELELDLVLADAPTAPLTTQVHAFRRCCRDTECMELLHDACPATLECGHPCGGIRGETLAQTYAVVPDEVFELHTDVSSDPNFLTCDIQQPNRLTAMPGNGPKIAVVDVRLAVGRSEWTVLYEDAIPGEEVACFGIVTAKTVAEPRPCSVANFRLHSGVWMYVARTGSVWQNGVLSLKTMEKSHKGDRISLILNQREGTVALCINNLFQGIIFEGITEPIYPTFIFENGCLSSQDPERILVERITTEEAVPGFEPAAGCCLPCLHCDLKSADEYCLICYCDSLAAQPCIQLQCGHVFHAACVKAQVHAGYPGIRISFKYLKCPVCSEQFKHWSMEDVMRPALQLEAQVSKMALQQLRAEGMEKHPSIVDDAGGDFYNDPLAFAMHEYVFYKCFKCQRPYFGGNYRCNIAEDDDEEDHADLVCPRCSLVDVQECPQHGKEWIAFKCRFCCTLATYTCWGNTHFCANCHAPAVWKTLVKYKSGANIKREPSGKNTDSRYEDGSTAVEYITCPAHISGKVEDCPLKVMHPPNGEEFGLGCTLCRDEKATVDVRKKMERDGVLEFLLRMKVITPGVAASLTAEYNARVAAAGSAAGDGKAPAAPPSGNDQLLKIYDDFHLTRGLAKAEKNKLKRGDMVVFLQRHAPSEDWLEVNNLSLERQQKISSLSRPRKKKERQRITRFYIDMLNALAKKIGGSGGGAGGRAVVGRPAQ